MIDFWLVLFLGCMAVDWSALALNRPSINYFSKPLTLFFLIVWYFTNLPHFFQGMWFGLGLVFALIGDVCLLFSYRYFLVGLTAFLITQILYSVQIFFLSGVFSTLMILGMFSIAVIIAIKITSQIRKKGIQTLVERMSIPIAAYAMVISVMVLLAIFTILQPGHHQVSVSLLVAGALLFFASDLTLAVDRFIRPLTRARLMVRISYHLGQFALTSGVLLELAS